MGLFDYFRSSYDLGEGFTDVLCNTKDVNEVIGGTLSSYWLDPHGYLYLIDYRNTRKRIEINKNDPRYIAEKSFLNHQWVPTGLRGRVEAFTLTKSIEIYPQEWDGEWENWPRMQLIFKYGRLVDFEDITERKYETFEDGFLAK